MRYGTYLVVNIVSNVSICQSIDISTYRIERVLPPHPLASPCLLRLPLNEIFDVSNIEIISNPFFVYRYPVNLDSRTSIYYIQHE